MNRMRTPGGQSVPSGRHPVNPANPVNPVKAVAVAVAVSHYCARIGTSKLPPLIAITSLSGNPDPDDARIATPSNVPRTRRSLSDVTVIAPVPSTYNFPSRSVGGEEPSP